jgi:hypothetical protein
MTHPQTVKLQTTYTFQPGKDRSPDPTAQPPVDIPHCHAH